MRLNGFRKLALTASALALFTVAACDVTKKVDMLVDASVRAFSDETLAYAELRGAQTLRQERSYVALSNWTNALREVEAQLSNISAELNVGGKKEQKIRSKEEVNAALRRLEETSVTILKRDYPRMNLEFVPPWKAQEVAALVHMADTQIQRISYLLGEILEKPMARNTYRIGYSFDQDILDTLEPCRELVSGYASRIHKGNLCQSAGMAQCGHQTSLSCVERGLRNAVANVQTCAKPVTRKVEVPRGSSLNLNSYINPGEELIAAEKIETIRKDNPNRAKATRCPVASERDHYGGQFCDYHEPKVTVYGWNREGKAMIRVENVSSFLGWYMGGSEDYRVNLYINDKFKATFVLEAGDDIIEYETREGTAVRGTEIKLMFQNYFEDEATGERSHGYVTVRLEKEDVPYLYYDLYEVQKYVVDDWVSGLINSCRSSQAILR